MKILLEKVGNTTYVNGFNTCAAVILKLPDHKILKLTQVNGVQKVFIGIYQIDKKHLYRYNKSFLNSSYQQDDKYKVIKSFTYSDNESNLVNKEQLNLSDIFQVDQKIAVQGVTKGCGFAGVMKRHGFGGLKASHGVSKAHRSGGSIGSRRPRRVLKGKKMAGHYGTHTRTVTGLQILSIKDNYMLIKGSVPGKSNNIVYATA